MACSPSRRIRRSSMATCWTGNLLHRGGRVVGLIDPAIYCGDPEIELADGTLFRLWGAGFFRRYAELAPFDPEGFAARRDLYKLYPLLVHVRYWDPAYTQQIETTLGRLGF